MVYTLSEERIFELLTQIVGSENISLSEADRVAYRYDIGPYLGKQPMCIIRPKSTDQVAEVLRVANRACLPVVPRSGGTHFAGQSLSWEGGIVLDLNGMNKVISIDPVAMVGVVETGVTWRQFDREAEKYGLQAGPIPQAGPMSCVGGAVSHNGMGHGSMRDLTSATQGDFVLGLEVVLPTGEIIKTGSWAANCPPVERAGPGSDLTGLFIGACGTLGVITQIVSKLRPRAKVIRYLQYGFEDIPSMVKGCAEALREHNVPSLFFMDYWALKVFANKEFSPWNIMFTIEGAEEEEANYHEKCVRKALEEMGGKDWGADFVRLWIEYPTEAWLTLQRFGIWHGLGNIAVHPSQAKDFWDVWEKIVFEKHKWPRERSFGFGWVSRGGGCVGWWPITMYRDDDPEDKQKAIDIAFEVLPEWVKMGCNPYDGGGKTFNYKVYWQKLGPYYELMKRIKKMIDPNNIMNPGIIFP